MKTIIYGNTRNKAFDKLQDLIDNTIETNNIERIIKGKDRFEVYMKNGDRYTALLTCNNIRGHRWQNAYIDMEISNEDLYNLILCKFIPKNEDGSIAYEENINDHITWY